MNSRELEKALLTYLSRGDSTRSQHQTLTTIYDRVPEAKLIANKLDEDNRGVDDKEQIRAALDQLVVNGLVQRHWGERDYEGSYRLRLRNQDEFTPKGGLLTAHSDGSTFADGSRYRTTGLELSEDVQEAFTTGTTKSVRVDSTSWTGLRQTLIGVRNAGAISALIDKALLTLPEAEATNSDIMQAAAYLKAAKELTDAPEPPSQLIWQLIGRAADVVGLIGLFYTIFSQAAK